MRSKRQSVCGKRLSSSCHLRAADRAIAGPAARLHCAGQKKMRTVEWMTRATRWLRRHEVKNRPLSSCLCLRDQPFGPRTAKNTTTTMNCLWTTYQFCGTNQRERREKRVLWYSSTSQREKRVERRERRERESAYESCRLNRFYCRRTFYLRSHLKE